MMNEMKHMWSADHSLVGEAVSLIAKCSSTQQEETKE